MTADSPAPHDYPHALPVRARQLRSLPRRAYRFRMLGMGLAALPLVAVLHEIEASWPSWAWVAFSCVLWPHLAYALARRSRDPFRAELRNFVLDSVFAGSWAPMIHFNILPSAVLITTVMADKINAGVRGLWLRSLPGMIGAALGVGLLTGFELRLETSTSVMLACLPIMVIHSLAVSLSTFRLIRRVQTQNQQLEQLSRVDALTGLDSRRHWQVQADAVLLRHRSQSQSATLMLLDVDCFKQINDLHGHASGDDVLGAIADLMRELLPAHSHAGRLGGDEFAVLLLLPLVDARRVAERLRIEVGKLRFPQAPQLDCSISIGLSEPPDGNAVLRDWLESADRALYRAKQAGRNRTEAGDPARVTES